MSAYIVEQKGLKQAKEMFVFFLRQFRKIMEDPASGSKELSIAIRGYGYLAAPCRMLLDEKNLLLMFNDMADRSQHIYFGKDDVRTNFYRSSNFW